MKTILEASELAEILRNCFENNAGNLNIKQSNLFWLLNDTVLHIMKNFEHHPSILKIKCSIK